MSAKFSITGIWYDARARRPCCIRFHGHDTYHAPFEALLEMLRINFVPSIILEIGRQIWKKAPSSALDWKNTTKWMVVLKSCACLFFADRCFVHCGKCKKQMKKHGVHVNVTHDPFLRPCYQRGDTNLSMRVLLDLSRMCHLACIKL